jgi:pimeloyl-ACP methyl ester carboxylesterase
MVRISKRIFALRCTSRRFSGRQRAGTIVETPGATRARQEEEPAIPHSPTVRIVVPATRVLLACLLLGGAASAASEYGGYAALRAAQRDGARYRCAVSFAGVADLNAMLRYDRRFLYGVTRSESWRKSAPDLQAVSPLAVPGDFSIPVLLVHGKADLRVPVNQSRVMADKLARAGKVVRYVEQPLADHHFSRTEDRLQFLQEMTDFLAKYNPAR